RRPRKPTNNAAFPRKTYSHNCCVGFVMQGRDATVKKFFCALLLCALCIPASGAVSAQGAVVMDADTGEVLFEQNADARLPMASTTKIMTALVALGEGNLDRTYTVKAEYAQVE